jgi:hypothetical protein
VKVSFETCGLQTGRHVDGIRLPQTPSPKVTPLDDSWREVTIDLTRKAEGLSFVVCPLKVIVRADDNPGRDELTVYVDEVRFEVGPPKAKD